MLTRRLLFLFSCALGAAHLQAELLSYAGIVAFDFCGAGTATGTSSATYESEGCPQYDRYGAGRAVASASYGALAAHLSADGSGTAVTAAASFSDELTIYGGTGVGLLEYTYHVQITPQVARNGRQMYWLEAHAPGVTYEAIDLTIQAADNPPPSVDRYTTAVIPFIFGQAFTFGGSISASASEQHSPPRLDVSATLTALRVYSGGSQLSRLRYSSDARATYIFEGATATPEPSTWILFAGSAAILAVLTRLRRGRS